MNFLQNKFVKKLLAKLAVLSVLIPNMLVMGIPVAHADFFSCTDFNAPKEGAEDPTAGWIVTILEEGITSASDKQGGQEGENIVNCFRVTKLCAGTTQECIEYASTCPDDAAFCKKVQIFAEQSGAELLYSYAGRIYRWAAGTIGVIAVFFLVVGGVEMSTAQGDQGRVEKAKERIAQSLAGLVILFLSALILYTINPNFFTLS